MKIAGICFAAILLAAAPAFAGDSLPNIPTGAKAASMSQGFAEGGTQATWGGSSTASAMSLSKGSAWATEAGDPSVGSKTFNAGKSYTSGQAAISSFGAKGWAAGFAGWN